MGGRVGSCGWGGGFRVGFGRHIELALVVVIRLEPGGVPVARGALRYGLRSRQPNDQYKFSQQITRLRKPLPNLRDRSSALPNRYRSRPIRSVWLLGWEAGLGAKSVTSEDSDSPYLAPLGSSTLDLFLTSGQAQRLTAPLDGTCARCWAGWRLTRRARGKPSGPGNLLPQAQARTGERGGWVRTRLSWAGVHCDLCGGWSEGREW